MAGRNQHHVQRSQRPAGSGDADTRHVLQAGDEDIRAAFDMGVNVRTRVKRSSKQQLSSSPTLRRKVVNCLKCGKVFDCRKPNSEAVQFISSGGICTFCGAVVPLEFDDGTSNVTPGTGNSDAAPSNASNLPSRVNSTAREAENEAFALRDRLVEYDRHSAKRTNVIDDQSDYFAIDSNAWLSDSEKMELKRQQHEAEAAAEERRKRIVVTVDLLGRRVVMSDERGKEQEPNSLPGASGPDVQAVALAMAATGAERPQGGGSASVDSHLQRQRETRIVVCPSMAAAGYVFVQPQKKGELLVQSRVNKVALRKGNPPRLQHDDPFDEAAADLPELLLGEATLENRQSILQ